jgi:hypothetical protein
MLLLLPGLLAGALLFSPAHPLGRFPGPLALATALGLALLGLVTLPATLRHWTFRQYLVATGCVWLVVSLYLLLRLVKRGSRESQGDDTVPVEPPSGMRLRTALATLVASALVGVAACRGAPADSRWWLWSLVALLMGGIVAGFHVADRRSVVPEASSSPSAIEERGDADWGPLVAGVWTAVAVTVLFLTLVVHQNSFVGDDDVTYVGRTADFLAGGPMDLHEPSLGMPIPMDRGFVIATTSGLTAIASTLTGESPAALHNSLLPPLFMLAAAASAIALLSVLLGGHRLLVPLAALVLLIVLACTLDGHRSLAHLGFLRLLQPKSVHLIVLLPLQLATLVLAFWKPERRHASVACAMVLVGHLIHPWSTVVAGVWVGCFALYAAFFRRQALPSIAGVLAVTVGLGGLQLWLASAGPGTEGPAPLIPVWPFELVEGSSRLDVEATLGRYSLFRLGVLAVPSLVVLGLAQPVVRPLLVISLVTLALAFSGALSDLLAFAVPRSLLWRTRFMMPSAVHAASLAIVFYWAAAALARAKTSLASRHVAAVSVGAVLVGLALFGWASPGEALRPEGPVAELTKLDPETLAVAEALGGREAEPYVLVPLPDRRPSLSVQLPQIMPHVRLILSRPLVVEWFLGAEESERRQQRIDAFYRGAMSRSDFRALRQEFPVDRVVVDRRTGEPARQRALLAALGWKPGYRGARYEVWSPGPALDL